MEVLAVVVEQDVMILEVDAVTFEVGDVVAIEEGEGVTSSLNVKRLQAF